MGVREKKSLVLITGVLGLVGYHLALFLKEECGTKITTGLEPMLLDSVESRDELSRCLALLPSTMRLSVLVCL